MNKPTYIQKKLFKLLGKILERLGYPNFSLSKSIKEDPHQYENVSYKYIYGDSHGKLRIGKRKWDLIEMDEGLTTSSMDQAWM